MALTDGAVVLPGRGYAFINPTTNQAPPATTTSAIAALNLESATLSTGWVNLGHTSRDNNVSLGREGGETEAKGTWQNDALRTSTSAVTWTFTINALQLDNTVAALYFGGGDASGTDVFTLPDAPADQERALWICLVDGSTRVPLYCPKVAFSSADSIEVDPENFLEFSLKATVLKYTGSPLMSIYSSLLGV